MNGQITSVGETVLNRPRGFDAGARPNRAAGDGAAADGAGKARTDFSDELPRTARHAPASAARRGHDVNPPDAQRYARDDDAGADGLNLLAIADAAPPQPRPPASPASRAGAGKPGVTEGSSLPTAALAAESLADEAPLLASPTLPDTGAAPVLATRLPMIRDSDASSFARPDAERTYHAALSASGQALPDDAGPDGPVTQSVPGDTRPFQTPHAFSHDGGALMPVIGSRARDAIAESVESSAQRVASTSGDVDVAPPPVRAGLAGAPASAVLPAQIPAAIATGVESQKDTAKPAVPEADLSIVVEPAEEEAPRPAMPGHDGESSRPLAPAGRREHASGSSADHAGNKMQSFGALPASPAAPATQAVMPTVQPVANAASAGLATHAAQQIGAAIARDPSAGRIELRLDPPELGRVEIQFDFSDDALRAVVSAERTATADFLRRHSEVLMQHLREAGFSGVDLSFGSFAQGGGARSEAWSMAFAANADKARGSETVPAFERANSSFRNSRAPAADQALDLKV